MEAIEFKEVNKHLTKPEGWNDEQCFTLPVYNDGKVCISCWQPSLKEIFQLLFTRKIWLWIHSGNTQPPVLIDFKYPFVVQSLKKIKELNKKCDDAIAEANKNIEAPPNISVTEGYKPPGENK